jgi:RHS repeat-associated protein
MAVNIPKLGATKVYDYHYDQLNRIVAMDVYNGLSPAAGTFTTPANISDYRERISYDPNGNILTYNRHGDAARLSMDSLSYFYTSNTNRLHKVTDAATDAGANYNLYNDIKQGQADNNYQYDAIGNMIKDNSESITDISWSVYGKILSITKSGAVIRYVYDARGNRIMKQTTTDTTVYVRDASGDVMSVYNKPAGGSLAQTEIHLYGSSRLGMATKHIAPDTTVVLSGGFVSGIKSIFARGEKLFELSNHLGNVLVTISDRRMQSSAVGVTVDYYTADVMTANDYYPGGMLMPGRKFNSGYRYGFNGKEQDPEVSEEGTQYDYGFRIYDSRLVRFKSVDPLAKEYAFYTPYQYAGNNPVEGIDLDGLEYVTYKIRYVDGKMVSKTMVTDYRYLSEQVLNQMHQKRLTFTRYVNYGDKGDKPTAETYTKNFYSVYSMGFGPMGRGVSYEYEYASSNSPVTVKTTSFFDKETSQAPSWLRWLTGRVGVHGIYYGPGCPTVSGGEQDFKTNPYDFSLQPVDEVDGIAKQHDMDYEDVYKKTGKYEGWYDDINTIGADKKMVAGWKDYLKRAIQKGFKDKYTNRMASEEAIEKAQQGIWFFENIVIPHKENLKLEKERQENLKTKTWPMWVW